jgi:hypothetical protein
MPRPTKKRRLLLLMTAAHEKLRARIFALPSHRLNGICRPTDWAFLEIVAHPIKWERMPVGWYPLGIEGKIPPRPADGFTWAQLPALIRHRQKINREQPAKEILRRYGDSFRKVHKTIVGFRDMDWFERSRFPGINKKGVAADFISCTSNQVGLAIIEGKKCLPEQA